MKILIALVTLVALVVLTASSCPANYALPYLITDSRELSGQQRAEKFQYALPKIMPSTPTVAIAIQDFSTIVSQALSFRLIPQSVTESIIVFSFEKSAAWKRIRMNFWVSANEHVLLGCFHTDRVTVKQSRGQIQTSLTKGFSGAQKPVVRTFISGYEGTSDEVQIMVTPVGLEGVILSVGLTVGPKTNVTGITISFIAFSPSTSPFLSYGGSFNRNRFSGTVQKDLTHNIYRTPFFLVGLTQLSLLNTHSLDFNCQVSESFLLKVQSTRMIDSFALTYVAIGKEPNQICAHCGLNYSPYEDECKLKCPNGTEMVRYPSGLACKSKSIVPPSIVSGVSLPRTCPANAFDNGFECVCQIGYGYIRGQCSPLIQYQISTNSTTTTTTTTTTIINKPTPHHPTIPINPVQPQPLSPVPCPAGYQRINGNCMKIQVECPLGSKPNGVGSCICEKGYHMSYGNCVKQPTNCLSYQVQHSDGTCGCEVGFKDFGGYCARCPKGAVWGSEGRCFYVCGQNSLYSVQAGKCVCNPGFGLRDEVCQICPKGHFIVQGFCVTCPMNSHYSSENGKCICAEGYYTNKYGICQPTCGPNEYYDQPRKQCRCLQGLARVNGRCNVCPANSRPSADGDVCNPCRSNQELKGTQCVCMPGYAYNSAGHCTICTDLSSGFIVNGICSVCPQNLIYDGQSGCKCPAGKTLHGSHCVSDCKSDELVDSSGNCYRCPANKVVSNGLCVCRVGFIEDSCGLCRLQCPSGHFEFQGTCASCPLNTIYSPQIKGCTCPSDHYKNKYGVCQKLVLKPVTCPIGQYFNSSIGCVACKNPCSECTSDSNCLSCRQTGYEANVNGECFPKCGDGLIISPETCDTGSTSSAGCLSCRTAQEWMCSGSPSVCTQTIISPPGPTTNPPTIPNLPLRSSLTQEGKVNINSNNVFITLRTMPTFTFSNPTQMQSFIQASFQGHIQPTVYCAQRDNPQLNLFDCLLIYPSGVPNDPFKVEFKFDFQDKKAETMILVDPVNAIYNARTNSRKGSSQRV